MTNAPTRLFELLGRLRSPGPWTSRALAVVAALAFGAMVLWGLQGYRQEGLEVRWGLLAVAAVVGTPLAVALNSVELQVMTRISGARMSSGDAIAASLYASAANALPLPGSLLVRTWSLRRAGVSMRGIAGVQALAGATFVSVAAVITGLFVAIAAPGPGLAIAAVGAVGMTGLAWRSASRGRLRAVGRLAAVEAAMVASELARLSLVLVALGLEPTAPRTAGLVMAGVGAAAIGVFPAGLGLREALAAIVATATGFQPALAVAVSVTDRIGTSLVLAAMLAAAVAVTGLPNRPPVVVDPVTSPARR